jgi:hypothetical protein
MKTKHNKKSSLTMEDQAKFYDEHDVTEVGDLTKVSVLPGKIKKISIGIPQQVYTKAVGLSTLSGTGYQNILKMAMVIGLNELANKVENPH